MMTILFWLCAFLIAYTYVLYPLLLLAMRLSKRRRPGPSHPEIDPIVTLVVSVFNEGDMLVEKLDNLRAIKFPGERISFLFGSDGSTDRTVEILSRSEIKNLRVFEFPMRRGKAYVLNDLIPQAGGEIIVLSDANTEFRPDTISNLVRHFDDQDVGAVCGALSLKSDAGTAGGFGESLYWRYENALKQMESRISTTVGATGGVYAIRKSLFKPLPTDRAIPDDFVLPMNVLRHGARIVYDPEAVAYENLSNSVVGEFQRKVRIGTSDFYSIRELRDLLLPTAGFAAFALWSRKILRWFVPLLLILLFAATASLASESGFFNGLLLAQVLFYVLALIGYFLEKAGIRMSFFGLPYYFTAMNLALFIGFIRFLVGKQPFTWETVR